MSLSLQQQPVTVTSTGQNVDLAMPDVQNTLVQTRNTVISASDTLNWGSYIAMGVTLLVGAAFGISQVERGEAEPPTADDPTVTDSGSAAELSDMDTQPDSLSASEDEEVLDTLSRAAEGKTPPRTFGRTRGYWLRTVGVGVVTVIAGGGLALVPTILKDIQSGEVDEINRDLTDLMRAMLGVLSLPEGTTEDYVLESIGIDGTLVIGAKLKV
jgi:hypothetical protein